MSVEDALAFLERLANDEPFMKKARQALTADQFWALIKQADLEFSREEYLQAEKAHADGPPIPDPGGLPSILQNAFAAYIEDERKN
jgi:predicted ribosomally synthesized peptide with nif11-like leader